MLFAVIDIGSNAVRLLFANAFGTKENIQVEKTSLIRVPLRLGKDVFRNSEISKDKEKKLIKTMKAFKLLIGVMEPMEIRVCATSAMREAKNSSKIIKKINKDIGLNIEIISGTEEAMIIRQSNRMVFNDNQKLRVLVDVGGGSTEISAEIDGELIKLKSFKIGTIRIINNNYDINIWQEITDWLMEFKDYFGKTNVVGSGGNINKIRKLFGNKTEVLLPTELVEKTISLLEPLSLNDRVAKYNLRNDRADVIVPAAKIYLHILKTLQSDNICVPHIGLADGMIHQLYSDYLKK